MAHKEWEPDDFLDEFLDFDYRKPVPGRDGENSRGLPAEERTKSAVSTQNTKSFGLGDNYDEYRTYEKLRHQDAAHEAAAQADADIKTRGLRSSDALMDNILEPLSARRPAGNFGSAERSSSPAAAERSAGAQSSPAKTDTPAAGHTLAPAGSTSAESTAHADGISALKEKLSHIRASEIASEAIGAAKKLVSMDEDTPPEEIPSQTSFEDVTAQASSAHHRADRLSHNEPSGKTSESWSQDDFYYSSSQASSDAEGERDELAELFAELGESSEALTSEDNEAIRQAQQDAYDRYRGNYLKGVRRRSASGRAGWFPRWTSRLYVIALAAFAGSMTIMNVLPFGMLIAFYVVLGLLSIIILFQLRKPNVRKWARALASVTAILLIGGYCVGTAYAMGTLSFLDMTTVDNPNKVASITKEPFNVCITGIDVDGKIDEQGRSDVNMIVTVNPKTHQILMTSIPRDYQIYMPDMDYAMDKLTHTGFYSVDTTIGAEQNLLDININYYVKVNFTTVEEFIDAIGGVEVYSEYEFTPVKKKDWTVQKGWNTMNGSQALAFARERKAFVDGDNQRIKNQQAVLEAVIKKAMSSKTMLLSYNKILNNLRDYFQMSISSSELRSLFKLQLAKSPDWKIFKNTIIGGDGSMPTYTTGGAYAYVMTQDQTSIDNARTLINAVLEGRELAKDDDNNVYVVGAEGDAGGGETDGE